MLEEGYVCLQTCFMWQLIVETTGAGYESFVKTADLILILCTIFDALKNVLDLQAGHEGLQRAQTGTSQAEATQYRSTQQAATAAAPDV
jgi:hypothetical protein